MSINTAFSNVAPIADQGKKLPSLQFYPGDWKKDPGVQALSYHDRGVWFEILLLMHESEQRGRLTLNGAPMPEEALARLLGLDKQSLTATLTTILAYGVASREDGTGVIYSRRMVRDEKIRQIRTEAGRQGGNPVLLKQKSTTGDKQKPTPSSSSSVSSSEERTAADVASVDCPESFQLSPEKQDRDYTDSGRAQLEREFVDSPQPFQLSPEQSQPWEMPSLRLASKEFYTDFWPNVWKKIAVRAAQRAYVMARCNRGAKREEIMAGLARLGPLIVPHANANGIGVLHPATWLKNGRWADDPSIYTIRSNGRLTSEQKKAEENEHFERSLAYDLNLQRGGRS